MMIMKINVAIMMNMKIMTVYNQSLLVTDSNQDEGQDMMKDKMIKKIITQH